MEGRLRARRKKRHFLRPRGKDWFCRHRSFDIGAGLLALALLLIIGIGPCLAAGAPELRVKTAFLFNFTKFTEWPAGAFSGPDSPIVILIVGQDPIADELETLKGKTAQGRKIVVKRGTGLAEAERFHVLFICKNEGFASHIRPLRNRSVLTVSDGKQFSHNGGIIGLVTVDNRVSFEINVDALDRAGLKLNSQVLKLAKIVKDSGQKEDR